MVKPPRKKPQARKADQVAETIASFAPPPHWIEPCIPTLVAKPPKGDRWRHEVKWDGYRVCVVIAACRVIVRTRRGHDWTDRFKPIAEAAAELLCRNAIIDGEAVVLDAEGRASFSALQADLAGGGKRAVLYALDCLFLDGRDLRGLPLTERREALEQLIGRPKRGPILFSEEFEGDGAEFFNLACAHELEGIVSKRVCLIDPAAARIGSRSNASRATPSTSSAINQTAAAGSPTSNSPSKRTVRRAMPVRSGRDSQVRRCGCCARCSIPWRRIGAPSPASRSKALYG
jgi:ATP-dependent DNA ligase